jgi:hypothetical protein
MRRPLSGENKGAWPVQLTDLSIQDLRYLFAAGDSALCHFTWQGPVATDRAKHGNDCALPVLLVPHCSTTLRLGRRKRLPAVRLQVWERVNKSGMLC